MKNPVILLITPPLTQLNTPYPATAYLKGFLKTRCYQVFQADLGLELVLKMFCKTGLKRLFNSITSIQNFSDNTQRIYRLQQNYLETIDPVIKFLQNQDSTLAQQICYNRFLPEASRFDQIGDLETGFGHLGISDKARHLATLYLEDLADFIKEAVCPHFGFSRYAEKLALSATSFDPLENALHATLTLPDLMLLEILEDITAEVKPDVVGFSVPFPGNLFGALLLAKHLKKRNPEVKTLIGGGYPNTELRSLNEPRLFKYIDFVTLDDGEGPWLRILEYLSGDREIENLQRTFLLQNGTVSYKNNASDKDIAHTEVGTPDYSDLKLDKYISVIEVMNPMHRLWSDGRWNKLTIAHGCYWKRCSFCDITLDYISRYETAPATLLVDRIEQIIAQTGQTGFHFVDEAAPPLSLRDLAIELISRGVKISWWGNIRFEKTFTPDLCRLLAASGCIAVSGGLEVASDRLLTKMEKGVSIAQVARVTDGFTQAGIMVHAYLMYGFPSQTTQETIDSLEVVRQLFENNVLQSGFWHRFSMTAHSPVGKNPEKYGVKKIGPEPGNFADNDLWHHDPSGADHELFGTGLAKAIYNYMHSIGLDENLQFWFDFKVPRTSISRNLIYKAISEPGKSDQEKINHRLLWLGNIPVKSKAKNQKQAITGDICRLTFYEKAEDFELELSELMADWLIDWLTKLKIDSGNHLRLKEMTTSFQEISVNQTKNLTETNWWHTLREKGLLVI